MTDITPSDAQARAIRSIVDWYKGGNKTPQVFYLAGFAGTGKSTVYKTVREELSGLGANRTVTCAYTGKAANVLRRKGTDDAMTMHAAMYSPIEDEETGKVEFKLNPLGPAGDADLIGLDECSMVGEVHGKDLLSFGKKVLVMGDPGQLPPVSDSQGFFTSREPDAFLSEIHRQAAESPILRLATLARQGEAIPRGKWGSVEVLDLNQETQHRAYLEETQTLCGENKTRWTVTQRLRKRRGFEGPVPQAGERVMCMRNNRDLGIFNGGQGTMLSEPGHGKDGFMRFTVAMDDLSKPIKKVAVHPYHFNRHFLEHPDRKGPKPRIGKNVEEFDWGFVLTVHKAQGSEWPHVTVIDDSGVFREDWNKWLYTAFTRASDGLTVLMRN